VTVCRSLWIRRNVLRRRLWPPRTIASKPRFASNSVLKATENGLTSFAYAVVASGAPELGGPARFSDSRPVEDVLILRHDPGKVRAEHHRRNLESQLVHVGVTNRSRNTTRALICGNEHRLCGFPIRRRRGRGSIPLSDTTKSICRKSRETVHVAANQRLVCVS